jgi:hypothetical protein
MRDTAHHDHEIILSKWADERRGIAEWRSKGLSVLLRSIVVV